MGKRKSYLPYIIGTILLLGSMLAKGIIKRKYKQQQIDNLQQQEQRMEALKESLEDLENSSVTTRVQAIQ